MKPTSRQRLTLLGHLEELRKRLLISLAAVGLFALAAWFFSKPLLEFLTLPLRRFGEEAELYFHTPYEAFLTHLKVALVAGVFLGSPLLFTELWLFLAPGLYRRERQIALPLILVSVFLFLLGGAFAFWILLPLGLGFLLSFETPSLRPLLGIGPYFSFLLGTILASGIIFVLPVIVLGLVRGGVLSVATLQRARKGVVVLVFLLAAILTPSPDPVGQILLALPLLLLYEVLVRAASWVERKRFHK